MAQDPSELTFGPYRVVRRIGRGCMGVVYHARDDAKNRDVALKVMLPEILSDENARARFSREANAAAGLQHRNIVTVLEFSEDADAPYIAMEFLRGRSLADALTGGPTLSRDAKLDIAIQLCEGLQFAHEQGVVHRDVKPANIWLLDDGGVKLLDFGIARLAGSTVTQYGNVVGSAAYMAPEQLAGKTVDGRADIFSAGVVLYELLAGRRPFEADTVTGVMMKILHEPPPALQKFDAGISADVVTAIETALEKDPERRYAQAADFGADLRLARHLQIPIALPSDGTGDRAWPPGVGAAERVGTAERAAANLARAGRLGSAERPAVSSSGTGARAAAGERTGTAERVLTGTGAGPTGRTDTSDRTATAERRREGVLASSTDETALSFDLDLRPSIESSDSTFALPASAPVIRRPVVLGGIAGVAVIAVILYFMLQSGPSTTAFQVRVQTTPAGAAIAINGASTGKTTPALLSMTDVPESIRLTLDGFAPVEAPLSGATASAPLDVQYTLRRLLRIASEPAGARILFDGRDTGQVTPAQFPMPDPAPKSVELQLSGYASRRESVAPATLETGQIQWTLKAASAVATGAATGAPAGARVTVTANVTGDYPFTVTGCGVNSPASAQHSVTLTAPCQLQLLAPQFFLNQAHVVNPNASRVVEIRAPVIVRPQFMTTHESCRVLLDGKDIGEPIALRVNVVVGPHTVTLARCSDNQIRETRQFDILPGQTEVKIDGYIKIR